MIKKDKTHFIIEVPLPVSVRHISDSRRANVHGVRVRVTTRTGGTGVGRFRHTFNNGSPRRYPDGLEVAIESWMQEWGYAGMSLHEYLMKMFPRKVKRSEENAIR